MGWDGKKTEPMQVRAFACAGCGKAYHHRSGGTLIRVKHFLIHDNVDCRQLKAAKARAAELAKIGVMA